jgi:hypothetical protein
VTCPSRNSPLATRNSPLPRPIITIFEALSEGFFVPVWERGTSKFSLAIGKDVTWLTFLPLQCRQEFRQHFGSAFQFVVVEVVAGAIDMHELAFLHDLGRLVVGLTDIRRRVRF